VTPAESYLRLSNAYWDFLGELRWSFQEDALVYKDGSTFALNEEVALFLEGFAFAFGSGVLPKPTGQGAACGLRRRRRGPRSNELLSPEHDRNGYSAGRSQNRWTTPSRFSGESSSISCISSNNLSFTGSCRQRSNTWEAVGCTLAPIA
jgi:hypothetical protein